MVSVPRPDTEVTEILPSLDNTSFPLYLQLTLGTGTPEAAHVQLAVSPSARTIKDLGAVIKRGGTGRRNK